MNGDISFILMQTVTLQSHSEVLDKVCVDGKLKIQIDIGAYKLNVK